MFCDKRLIDSLTAVYKYKLKQVPSEVKEEIFLAIREEHTASAQSSNSKQYGEIYSRLAYYHRIII